MTLYRPALLLKAVVSGGDYERWTDFYLPVPPRMMELEPSTKVATDKGIELKNTLFSESLLCEQMSQSTQKVQDVCPTPQIVIAPLRSRTPKGLLRVIFPPRWTYYRTGFVPTAIIISIEMVNPS